MSLLKYLDMSAFKNVKCRIAVMGKLKHPVGISLKPVTIPSAKKVWGPQSITNFKNSFCSLYLSWIIGDRWTVKFLKSSRILQPSLITSSVMKDIVWNSPFREYKISSVFDFFVFVFFLYHLWHSSLKRLRRNKQWSSYIQNPQVWFHETQSEILKETWGLSSSTSHLYNY